MSPKPVIETSSLVYKHVVETTINDLWEKRHFFCFQFDNKEELIDLAKFITNVYDFIPDVEFKLGYVIQSTISFKYDDQLEDNKDLITEACRIIKSVSLEEMNNFVLKPGDENKFENTTLYMAHIWCVKTRVKFSQELYQVYVDHFIGWWNGVSKMHEFLNKKEKKTFQEYMAVRKWDIGGKMIVWQVGKVLLYEEEIEEEQYEHFADLFSQHMYLGNDLRSMGKPNSKEIPLFQSFQEFEGMTLKEIKTFLKKRLDEIEKEFMECKEVKLHVRTRMLKMLTDCLFFESLAGRYNDFGEDFGVGTIKITLPQE